MAQYPADLERWRRAAEIASEARDYGATLAVPGASRREVVEAAHYTPSVEDEELLEAGDVLKVDIGAHIGGAIADTALTVEVGGGHVRERLIRASREALEAGIEQVRPGVAIDEISQAIETAIHRHGFKPIQNLTGHTIEPYLLHAGTSIPNVHGMSDGTLSEGQVVAIEPFATNGVGAIENGPFGNIVRFRADPGPGDPEVARLFQRFRTLPFTARHVAPEARPALARIRRKLQNYPVFVEAGGGLVSQAEHTVLVVPGGVEVLTAPRPGPA
jgi:methionyl aminopeptidase